MIHLLLTLVGIVLLALTLPLVLVLAMVTIANWLPASGNSLLPQAVGVPGLNLDAASLAIIVPAHNEEFLVGKCVTSLRASAGPTGRILVVAHNCTDSTATRAREAGADVLVYDDPAARGKGFALRHGFQHALDTGAKAVLIVDADSIVSANTVNEVLSALGLGSPAQPVGFARIVQCHYEMVSTTERSSTRLAALAFRGFNVVRPRGRERLGLSAGILGNGFAILRPVLETIPYDAFSVVEDLEYHLHLVSAGERVRYLDQALITADFPESRSGEAIQRSRWEGGRLLTARLWALPLAAKILRGNLRLIEPLCDLTGLPLAFGVFGLLLTLILGLVAPLPWLLEYALLAICIVLAHVLTAAWIGPDFLKTLQLLALSPIYILRKLWMIPGVIRGSSTKAAWVRTERDTTL
jgi:cellulose synthase/poly-beta-1,6-N-acetylglucosamine synthase-like glycosyltransferase